MKNKGLIEVHVAVLFFGLAGLFGKLIVLPSTIIVLGRVLFAMIFLFLVMSYRKQSLKLDRIDHYFALGMLGAILALHWVSFFKAIQVSTVAVGLLTFSTFPVFVTFLEPAFFKEKMRLINMGLALITFAGVALVIPNFEISNNITQGALWGILSGFTFALLTILNKKYVQQYSSLVVAFYQDAAATIVLFPFLFIVQPVFHLKDLLFLCLLGIVFTGIAHSLFIKGLSSVKAHTASIIASLEPVYGILAAILLFSEVPSLRECLGGMIILGSAFYVTVRK